MPNLAVLELDPPSYWARPADLADNEHIWKDLDPEKRGMLSSDQIRQYVQALGMIYPFDPGQLKPASYELTLGPLYQLDGKDGVLTKIQPTLEIPQNSIVFVATGERLVLPHYIIGRFDLQIDLIYRGLLLGTGPQVDPGFRGVLSCPLHNISDNPIRIQLGDQIAKIDFEKTSGFPADAVRLLTDEQVRSDDALYLLRRDLEEVGVVLFNRGKQWKRPITEYPPGQLRVSSSIARLDRAVSRFQNFGIWGAIGLGLTILGFAVGGVNLVANSTRAATDAARAATDTVAQSQSVAAEIRDLTVRLTDLERERDGLRSQVQQLQSRLEATPQAAP